MRIFLISIITSILVYKLHVWRSALFLFGFWIIYVFGGILLFTKGLILNFVYVPFSMILTYIGTVVYYYLSEEKSNACQRGKQ